MHQHFARVAVELTVGENNPEAGVQLVDVTVRRHARIGLVHARAAEQAGFACIAGARIDLHRRAPVYGAGVSDAS